MLHLIPQPLWERKSSPFKEETSEIVSLELRLILFPFPLTLLEIFQEVFIVKAIHCHTGL